MRLKVVEIVPNTDVEDCDERCVQGGGHMWYSRTDIK